MIRDYHGQMNLWRTDIVALSNVLIRRKASFSMDVYELFINLKRKVEVDNRH